MQRKDSTGVALPCSPPGPVSVLLPLSLSLSFSFCFSCVCVSLLVCEGGRQRGNKENNYRRREKECVYVCMSERLRIHS